MFYSWLKSQFLLCLLRYYYFELNWIVEETKLTVYL